MKKITFFNLLIAFFGACLFFSGNVNAQNLIVNGDFEEGEVGEAVPTPWDGFKNRIQNDNLEDRRVGQVEAGDGSLFQVFDVTPGETYVVSFDYRWIDGPQANSNMVVRFRDPDVSGPDGNLDLVDDSNGYALNSTVDEWMEGEFSVIIPDGLNSGRLQFFKGNGNKPLNLDNVVVQLDNTASVRDLKRFDYNYYPNPATDFVRLSANEKIDAVEVYNLNGRKVLSEVGTNNTMDISVSNLNAGVYILKTQIGNAIGSHKLIIK